MPELSQIEKDGKVYDLKDVFAREEVAKKIPIPATAAVGQTIRVSAVDDNGTPTEWKMVTTDWHLIADLEVTETVRTVTFDVGASGEPLKLRKMYIIAYMPKYEDEQYTGTGYGDYKVNGSASGLVYPSGGWDNAYFIFDIEHIGSVIVSKCYKTSDINASGAWNLINSTTLRNQDAIKSFTWGVFGRSVLPESKFIVWGVDA